MKILRGLKSILCNLHFLLFVNGFLLAGYLFFKMQDDYENRLFNSITQRVITSTDQGVQELQIKKALSTTYYMLRRRSDIFKNTQTGGFLDDYINPVSSDIITAEGACGSYSSILCRLLNSMGYTTRFAQMTVSGKESGHIITEVKTDNGWAVLDPLYNLSFTKQDGQLASFDEVAADWKHYSQQVPQGYDPRYNYSGVRYTNWNKIPVLMPLAKSCISLFMSKDVLDHFSIRSYLLRKYMVCANFLFVFMVPFSIMIIYRVFRVKKIATVNWLQWQVRSHSAA